MKLSGSREHTESLRWSMGGRAARLFICEPGWRKEIPAHSVKCFIRRGEECESLSLSRDESVGAAGGTSDRETVRHEEASRRKDGGESA